MQGCVCIAVLYLEIRQGVTSSKDFYHLRRKCLLGETPLESTKRHPHPEKAPGGLPQQSVEETPEGGRQVQAHHGRRWSLHCETYRSEHSIVCSWTLHLMPSADLLKQSSQKPLSLAILSACSLHSTDYIYKCLFLLTQLQVRASLSIQLKQTSFTSPLQQFPLLVTVHLILYMGLLQCSSPTLQQGNAYPKFTSCIDI